MNAAKNVMSNNYKNMELDEYLKEALKETGYGGVDIQKTPIGTRITLYVTRPGLVIGRKGAGIKDLTSKLEQKFGLNNPQNSVMGAGAMGVEVTIAGKLRSERAHFEKHVVGVMPKSGNSADKIVKLGVTDVLTKMGLMGIQLRIALKNEMPSEFELIDSKTETNSNTSLQSDQNVGEEIDQNIAEVPVQKNTIEKKNNVEKNNQNIKKPYQKQNLKTKDIKDKSVKQNNLKDNEKGESVKSK